jgi:fructuronate reductase
MVHLGVGAFHRAHIAVYLHGLLRADSSWGIIGASLQRPDTRAALAPQDIFYTLVERGSAGTTIRVIGSLLDVPDASAQRRALLRAMADPQIASSRSPSPRRATAWLKAEGDERGCR